MKKPRAASRMLAVLALAAATSACAAAVGAAAGAAAAIAYDDRNASTEIGASVFGEMGITVTNRSEAADGSEAQLRGEENGRMIRVDINRASATTTRVVVTARDGEIEYRPSRAGEILQRIIARAS